jgi:hypothetical protein
MMQTNKRGDAIQLLPEIARLAAERDALSAQAAAQLALLRRLETRADDYGREVAAQQIAVRDLHAALVSAKIKPAAVVPLWWFFVVFFASSNPESKKDGCRRVCQDAAARADGDGAHASRDYPEYFPGAYCRQRH